MVILYIEEIVVRKCWSSAQIHPHGVELFWLLQVLSDFGSSFDFDAFGETSSCITLV